MDYPFQNHTRVWTLLLPNESLPVSNFSIISLAICQLRDKCWTVAGLLARCPNSVY